MFTKVDVDKYKHWLLAGNLEQREVALHVFWHTRIRDAEIDDMIVNLLDINCVCLRRDTMRMLSKFNDVKFKNVFLQALDDSDWAIRGRAILGLKKIDPNFRNIPQIARLIQTEKHPFCRRCLEDFN